MEQQSNYPILNIPADEKELYQYLDQLYIKTQKAKEERKAVKHNGLLEIITSEVTIQTAVHTIKANRGADTPGTDNETMRQILELPYEQVIDTIQEHFHQIPTPDDAQSIHPQTGKNKSPTARNTRCSRPHYPRMCSHRHRTYPRSPVL